MAKGNVNPNPSPNPNPAPNPTPSAPPPTGTGGGGPTGNTGFSMSDSSMQGLQNKAGDLGSRLASISSGLRGLNFSGNALGPIGLFAVPALNASNDNAVAQADKGAKAFNDVQSGIKATHQTAVNTDTSQGTNFKSFDTSTTAKPPPGSAGTTLGGAKQDGPKVSGPGTIAGGTGGTKGSNVQGGPKVSTAPNIKGGTGPVGSGGVKTPGGPSVGAAPNIKGGTGPVGGSGVKTPGGPSVGAVPNIKGGAGPLGGGAVNTPGGPSVGVAPNIKGGTGPVGTGGVKTPGGPSVGATPNIKGGAGPVGTGIPKGPGGVGPVAPPVIGGTPGSSTPKSPGTPGGGGKGTGIPTLPGTTPGSTPGSTAGTKPGVTPPGPQNAVTSPSRGTTPPGMSPGMAPPMAPGATPGAAGGERGGSKFGAGSGKGLFDAPKPGTPDSTITKAPPSSTSTPPPAPKPGAGVPGAPTSGVPGSGVPGSGVPGSSTPGAAKPGVPGNAAPSTPGPQSAVTPPSTTAPRGGIAPPTSPTTSPAASPGMAPPMAPGATPGATGGERGGSKFGTGAGKGVFDAPKPPTPDNTITRAPGTSPSTPPPAPKPTPLTPQPSSTTTPPPQSRPAPTPPPAPSPAPKADTAPAQTRPAPNVPPPAPNVPPANTPTPAPATNTPPPTTPAPKPDTTPTPATPKADTPPAQTRPAPPTNVPPVNTPSTSAPSVNPPSPNTPPANAPSTNTPPANAPSPNPSVNAPSPNPATNVPPANVPSANPAANVPPANVPPSNTPPVQAKPTPDVQPNPNTPKPDTTPGQAKPTPDTNTPPPAQTRPAPAPPVNTPPVNTPSPNTPTNVPGTDVPPANTPSPSPNTPTVQTRPAPGGANPQPNPTPTPNTTTTAAPDLVVAPPLVTPAPAPNPTPAPSANPNPNVVPRSHPAASNFQAQPRPDGGKGKKRAAIKKYLGINFIKGLFNKPPAAPNPTPAPNPNPNPAPAPASTAPPNPWTDLLKNPNPKNIDVEAVKTQIDTAVNDGKPATARILINRLKNTEGGAKAAADLQAHYDQAVANKRDAGKVDVPKQLHFAWFGDTPSPESVNGMLEWAAQTNENNGWKATLWTDGSSAKWDPAVVKQLKDAGIDIKSDVDKLVDELSDKTPPTKNNTTLKDVYAAAQSSDAKAYNLASDIARYAVLAKNGGVYVDVDIKPGSLSLDNIGDMKMHPTDVPVIGPRLRDTSSVQKATGDAQLTPENVQNAADAQWKKGELGNAFIVTPPDGALINKFAEVIPQKFDTLVDRVGPKDVPLADKKSSPDFLRTLKEQAPDVSGPNALADNGLSPQIGLIGQVAMDHDGLNLGYNPGYMPTDVPAIGKTDFEAMFDPDVKNQWNGIEWVTPESESQLDRSTDTRPAPSDGTPKDVKSGGAPPKLEPPTPESHHGKDVITDESWRHDPAKTADWFAPKDPADRSTWADRRDDTNVRTVDVVVHDVRTDSTPSNIKSYQGLINYDLRRIETSPGNFVQEYTVKVHVDPAANVDPDVIAQVKENATNGVNNLLNQGYRLPSGDQFHLNLEFTDNKADAHTSIKVDPDNPNVDQTHWNPDTSPEVLAHETLHYLGIPDEYSDSSRVFQQHDTNSGVHKDDGGMMGSDVHGPDPGLRPRHLWLVERTANSQVMVPDTRIEPAGPATVPPPANPNTSTDTRPDADTRPMPDKRPFEEDSDSDAEPEPVTKKPKNDGEASTVDDSSMDVDENTQPDGDVDMNDSQLDNLADQFDTLSLGDVNFSYNPAFAQLANGDIDLPTKDNYLAKLKESVEGEKRPSFVVNMIVSHNDVGNINAVIDSITKDAGPIGKDMVFVVGVNGPNGSGPQMATNIESANNAVAGRKEPVALVPLPTFDPKDGFPFGRMRNGTMHSPATTFAIGALGGKNTHPYISFQDFDTGSRQVTGGQKDVFTHFTESLNPPGAGPIRPLLYSGGYRVGDPQKLVDDTRQRIASERDKINSKPKLTKDDQADLDKLKTAEKQLAKPEEFVAKFEQAMRDDMDARNRQKDSAPLLPYSPEPNLFMDAAVAVVDPDVKFSDGGNEFGDLSQSINEFAGKELADIHGTSPDSGIDVDLQTNRNPLRGENFTSDFVDGAVGTDLSRLALGFAKSEGKSWPQSHVALTSVTNRMYGGDPNSSDPNADRAAKADVSGAKIRDEFGDKKPNKDGTPNAKNKPHQQREAQQKIEHTYGVDPDTGKRVHTGSTGGWTPSNLDALKLGWEDKNSLNQAVSAQIPGHGTMGIDPQTDPTTVYPPKKEKVDGKAPVKTEADVQHIDASAKQHKMAAMLNLAMSANTSNVTRTFGTLEHGVLPIAADPRPDGLFNAVHDALTSQPGPSKKGKSPQIKSAADLRTGAIQKGSTASPAITTQIANFRQEHGLHNSHLVNALIEPGPTPQTKIPAHFNPGSGDVEVDNTTTDPDWTPITDAEADAHAQENAAEQKADNAKAAKAEELAVKLLATEIGRPITIHGPDGVKTVEPFFEKKKPVFPPPLELDATPNPNGKTSFTPHDPGPSTRSAPEVQTRPAPPTPNPVIPMTTVAPPAVGQVMPGTQNLPSFFQDNKALGTIAPTDVRGAENVTGAIPNLKPNDAARIQQALKGDFESFLDGGRNFQVKIGNTSYEANVRATMQAQTDTAPVDAPHVKVDAVTQSGNSSATTHTVATANDIGGSATAGVAMGPYGSLGGKAQLATPAQSQSTSSSLTDQRAIRAGEGSTQATVQVLYDITLTAANGTVRTLDPVNTGTDVTLQIPNDLATITSSGNTSAAVTPPDAQWGAKLEHPAPEAVSVDNQKKAFNDVAAKLHPSITKVGAPGREALQNFLSPTEIRNNLGAMLGGAYVTSPDLLSPHASKGAAVQMTAKLQTAELVGTHNSSVLRLHDTASHSSGVSSTTKSGGGVTAGFGGNIGVPNAVGGQVGATVGYSATVAESVNAGINTSHKSGIQIKGDTGLYKVTAEVEVRTPSGDSVKVPVTTYMRVGLPEAGALGLPTPDGTRNSTVDPATAGTKFAPPYLADAIAAGNAKVGEFEAAAQVQGQVEDALRKVPGFEKFLPSWNDPNANPRSSKGKSFADVAEQLANQRKLTSQLSPAALKTNMDSLMGPGVQVQLKNSGTTSNTYVNVTVKAKLTNPQHLGQADARNIRDASSTGPKLDASTTTSKGWSGGVEGKVTIPAKTSVASLTPTPQFGVKYNHGWSDKTAAGPTVNSTSLNAGSPNAQVFRHDVEFDVEITTFTRPRAWVRRIVPGAPGFHSPEQNTVAKTGTGDLEPIKGGVNLWVSDSSTLDNDPGSGFKPGDPELRKLKDAPTVKELLSTRPKEKSPDFLHVEAVANTTALRDQAIDALNRAAGGDSALTVPGTASRAQIDKMFSPENIKANLRTLTETGIGEQGLKYDRRMTDRTGAIGVRFGLSNPKIVSISDNTGTENANTGGYKAGQTSSTSRSVDITGGINVPVKPNVTGSPAPTSGSGGVAVAGKVTPWSDSKSSSTEVGGSVDRNFVTPSGGRTVLVQLDADVTVVGESRATNFLHGGTPKAEGATVTLPKSVFVRVTEDVARDMGLLPDVKPNVPKPDFPKMAPPSTIVKDQPGALGLSVVESVPDLSNVVSKLTEDVNAKTAKRFGDPLLPDSVLKDSMSNLQRLVDFSSPASVKAMIDSAMDGGVPLLVHQPGTFGKDSFQITLRAKADTPKFQEVVNDGVEMESTLSGSQKVADSQGRGTGWALGLKAPGLAAPGSANPNVSGTVGAAVAANVGQSKSSSVTTSTTDQFSQYRGASGPAARYTVPIEFELVVEKGDKVVATAPSGPQEMTVRLHADNQKVAGHANPKPYWTQIHTRTADQGSAQAASQWQQNGSPATLPPSASVENLRGAKDLRAATLQALKDAGAGKGLTGKGTGALNSLLATLSPENLQPHLPGMLSGPLTVPGLHEAALTFGQDADVKVYAKLVDPSLGSLSDNVALENPKSQVTSTSGEAKVTESGDVSVGLATGGAGIKQNTDPKDNVSVGVSGVELRHAAEDATANSGGPTDNKTNNLKPKATTGLVQFGVEYRVVATIGGKTAVVDLSVPNSAAVRMQATDAQTVLGHEFGADLTDAQADVKKAADDWRTAEVAVDTARHDAQQVINAAAAALARNDSDFTRVQIDYNAAIEKHLDEQAKLPPLEARAETARAEAARTLETVADLTPRVSGLSVVALSAQFEVDNARAEVDTRAQAVRSLENQLTRTPDAPGLSGQVDAARQAHADAQAALQTAEAEAASTGAALSQAQQQLAEAEADLVVQREEVTSRREALAAQQEVVAEADAARTDAETRYQEAVAKLDADRAAQEARIKDAETKLDDARRAADDKQKQWWDRKAVVDDKIADYNRPPSTTTASSPSNAPSPSNGSSSRDVQTRPAPQPPNAPSTGTPSTGTPATDAPTPSTESQAPTSVPGLVVASHLKALTADAMLNASPLAQQVETELRSNPGTYLDHEAGLDLLRASVVLDTKTDDIATLIQRHGVEAVARAFNAEFGRPIIETAQLQQFGDLSTPESRTAFDGWAHQLWDTIGNTPSYQDNPGKLADDVFNHEKGYNRGTNFAQETALTDLTGAPSLQTTITDNPHPGPDVTNQAFWVHKVLSDAQVLPAGSVSPDRFTQAVTDNRTVLGDALGVELDDVKVTELTTTLQDNGMVDDDPAPANEPAPPNAPELTETELQLAALTDHAMENATPQMKAVEAALRSDPQKYVHHEAGLNLLRASVVLHTRTDDVSGLMFFYGLDEVTKAFNTQFEAPVIEAEQLDAFMQEGGAANYESWAHQLWDTIGNTPAYEADPGKLAGNVFNHDKGYNHAVDLAQQTPLDDPAPSTPPADTTTNPLHSTETSAPWFDPHNPVSSQAIADARATTPASSWVRGEDGGVLNTTQVGPHGIKMQAWRGPIAYDNRVMDVDGVPVRDFTVRLHLNNGTADVQDRTRAGVEEMFNQGYRLPSGEQFHVTVEFTDNPADAHATIDVTDDPQGRANQLTWPANTDSRRLAHEVGHFLGLRDEYLETGDVKPIFQHQDGKGRVVDDNSPMTQGIDRPDARLKPRHLQLVNDRMTALQSHNRPQSGPDVQPKDVPAPNMPKRDATHMDVDPEADPTKRAREAEVQLVNENGVHNAAFQNLANGRTLAPITADNYLRRTQESIANNEPPSFVVSMIVRAGELDQLGNVVNGVMANTNNMDGRVAFVLGVNASTQQEIDAAIAAATPVVNGQAVPIALVSVPHGPKGFKFGDTRNATLDSDAHEFAVTALAANGTHPYVSVMDFDAGDRRTRQGGHVFDHVAQLVDGRVGDDVVEPSRPLMIGGGYRVTATPQQLHADVLARINSDTKTTDAQKQAYREKLSEPGFHERFEHVINADMHARRNQQAIHPLLPYTPEPNLFVDGLVPLADPAVRFGEGQAEFGQLGQSLNRFYARELAKLHTPEDPADMEEATERARVDVQNNRHPVRGQAFTTDFVAGDTGTDLSRIAYGLIKDGKLPQSHTALPNVSERFFDGKSSKAGTKFADERERLSTGAHAVVEPFLPPANGQTTTTWAPPKKMETQLGAPAKNRLNPAVSAPLPAPFTGQQAGIQKDQKVVAAHGLVASDHVNHTLRQLRYLNEDVLVRQPAPPTSPTGLYAAVGQVRGVDPATLRQQVVSLAATHQAVMRAVADFTVTRPMHQGHLYGALVENIDWHMQPDGAENSGAGNARDLVGHLIATQLSVNVRIHQPGSNPILLRPMGPPFEETIDVEMVLDGRQVTYRPLPGLQQDVEMH
ncbi:glycosyltransferase [Lentzea rhizosphaerae]|uniref:Glycosyltransferase n=1 Tax=Lentzea rhizosphaerae TaxID=2041025 RepID=A0ABV8C5F5_9PSEU